MSISDHQQPVVPTSTASMEAAEATEDYKVTSLSEVQRIIGLSLSKIQLGRNQRGGLPLHKNLLVATVLNKARDLYMQETMYMNYKMMTGQYQHQQQMEHHYHHYNMPTTSAASEASEAAPVEASEADYDEDSESDVEDEDTSTTVYPPTSMASMMHMMQQQQKAMAMAAAASMKAAKASDEGFIDDCDCDARNFSTSDSRVPFQYCYHCAPFHPSNGRGPTLVTCTSPLEPVASTSQQQAMEEAKPVAIEAEVNPRGTKRRSSDSLLEDDDTEEKKRRESLLDESGYASDSSHEMFHPAFRASTASTTSTATTTATCTTTSNGMEIDQITSLVSIFSFGQHIMAAAAAANSAKAASKKDAEDTEKEKNSSEDSDSESDTSSDSGHSSDDHEALAKEETTLCMTTTPSEASPPCVQVASL